MKQFYVTKRLCRFLFALTLLLAGATNARANLAKGDLAVIGMNSASDDYPSNTSRGFAVVALNSIAAGEVIFFTDRGWVNAYGSTSGHFIGAITTPTPQASYNNEGVFKWTPSQTVPAGTVIIFTLALGSRTVSAVTGNGNALPAADLSITDGTWINTNLTAHPWSGGVGDQIIIYQGSESSPSFIYAFNNIRSNVTNELNGWSSNPDATEPNNQLPNYSEVPTELGSLYSLGFLTSTTDQRSPNMIYVPNLTRATKAAWLASITKKNNWTSTNAVETRYDFTLGFGSEKIKAFELASLSVTAPRISVSGATGTNGVFRTGDVVTATWDNSASGDNNADISSVTMDFSQFGGGAAVTATNSNGIWTATYTIVAGNINGQFNLNVAVTAIVDEENSVTTSGTNNAIVDNQAPSVAITSSAGVSGGSTFSLPIPVTIVFSEAITNFEADDIVISNAAISGFSGSGGIYTFDLTPVIYGIVTVDLAANKVEDAAGNGNVAAQGYQIEYQVNLPVSLVSYIAKIEGDAAKLEWSTANETNNSRFEIEHSSNGKDFTVTGMVEAGGYSSVKRNYSWYDRSPLKGKNYYRLVQVDYDGTKTKFNIKSLTFGDVAGFKLFAYPNPVTEYVEVALPENTRNVELTDLNGRVLRKVAVIKKQNTINVPVNDLLPGTYIVRLITGEGTLTSKFVKF